MGDSWGNAPQEVENSWPISTHEEPSNKYAIPRNVLADDHGRPPNRSSSSVERINNRDFESGLQVVNKERAPSHSREQIRYKDNDRTKRSSENGDWKSQNQPLENRDNSFNPQKNPYQTSNNYDDGVDPHEMRSQKGFDNNSRSSGRPPMPTSDYEQRRDPRNSRPYSSYENDSSSRKPSRAASYDKLTNVLDSHTRHSPSVQGKFDDDESLVLQEAIHNSLAEKRSTGDKPERWRDETEKLTDDQNWKSRENRTESTRFEPTKKEYKDAAVQTNPIDLEPIVQLVYSADPEIGDLVRKRLFSLGLGGNTLASSSAPTRGRSLLGTGSDELNNRGNDTRKSQSTSRSVHSPSVNNDSHGPGNMRDNVSKTDNDRNSRTMEFESRQPSGVPASRIDEQRGQLDSPRIRDTTKTSVRSPEPWEVPDVKPGKSEIRTSSPGNIRRHFEDRDDNVMNIRGPSRPPTSETRWIQTENQNKSGFRNHPDSDSLRVRSSDSRGPSPNHASRDVKPYESFPVNKQENDPHLEGEPRSYTQKVDPRTASPRGVYKRDSSISSKVSQPKIEALRSIDPQEVVVNKPVEKRNDSDISVPLPNTDTWDSGPADPNDWLQTAAIFERQLKGESTTEKDDRPLKRDVEPWENPKPDESRRNQKSHNEPWENQKPDESRRNQNSHNEPWENQKPDESRRNQKSHNEPWENRKSHGEPWETTTHNDNPSSFDVPKNNGKSEFSANNNSTNSFEDFGNRAEQKDDRYSKGSSHYSEKTCYNCHKPGHLSRECPESSTYSEDPGRRRCFKCNKFGHMASLCPESNFDNNGERHARCYDCGSPDHISSNCPSKTLKPCPFSNPEPSGISPEEAWNKLLKADRDKDIEDFKKWLEEFAKASPNETFQTIERKLRSHECTGRIIALKREGIPFTSCLVDLQGNSGKTYVAQPVLSRSTQFSRASGTYAGSEEENYRWLADSGFLCDDPSPACFNCMTKGHFIKNCPMPKKESERPVSLPCQHCDSPDHLTKYCDRRDRSEKPYGSYNYGDKDIRSQPGYNRREHGRSERFSDNNGAGAYGNDDRRPPPKWGSYDNDGRDGNKRRGEHTDDYFPSYDRPQNNDSFNKNRYNSNQGSYHNDDKSFNRNRGGGGGGGGGGYNDSYQQRDFSDQGRYSNQRGNNNNRDRGDFSSRDDRNSANRGYNDYYSKSVREQDNYLSRNRRDRSRDPVQSGNGSFRDVNRDSRINRDDTNQKWDSRQRSTSVNRSNSGIEPASKKDGGPEWNRLKGEVGSWNNSKYENNSWPAQDEGKKNSFNNNNDRFAENKRPRGNSNNDEFRGRSAQPKEVLASSNSGPPNESAKNLSNPDRRVGSNIDNVEAWWD